MESLLLLVLIAVVAGCLLSGCAAGLHSLWMHAWVRMQAALVEAHLAHL